MAAKTRDECVYLAKVAESAERHSEMLGYAKRIVSLSNAQLSVDERSLLSVAYKNVTGSLRNSWRTVSQLEEIERLRASKREFSLIRRQKATIEGEIVNACKDILQLLTSTLIPAACPGDDTVFYHKMKGDYYRYLAELSRGDFQAECANSSLEAYKLAYKIALNTLDATHPTRLGLVLNFAVYYRDVMNSPERACHLAKHAFDEAVENLDQMPEATYRDSLLILQLLRDDLLLWDKEMQDRDEEVKVHQ